MDRKGLPKDEVMRLVSGMKELDISFGSGRIFGSMCTSPHPIAAEVDGMFLESNLGNPGLYPGTLEMEQEIISMLGSLLHLDRIYGHVLSGGTEANITALYRAKKITGRKKVIFPASAHFSVLKALSLLDMEPVMIPLDEDFRMDVQQMEDHLDDEAALVLSVAGTTELGVVDPVDRIGSIMGDVPLHVDAAFGGFVLPFLETLHPGDHGIPPWDFRVKEVTSLSVDPHKMGGSTIPAGCLLFREEAPLKHISVSSPYLTSTKAYTLAGTRDSGAVAAAYAVMKHLGREGYERIVAACMDNTSYLEKRLRELGLEPVIEPVMNILAVHHPDPDLVQERMRKRGFFLSRVRDPPALRFVVMPHVTRASIDVMIPELEGALKD